LAGDIAFNLIDEILHQKFPEKDEDYVTREGMRFYEKLFGEKFSGAVKVL